jgi:SAM-dependent methyltransferase
LHFRRQVEKYQNQSKYFAKAKYRAPSDPVVAAYVLPKLELMERIVPLKNASVADIGCGNGVFTLYLMRRCRSVIGVDFSANMLSENPCGSLVQADVARLPLESRSVDVAFEANVLHHVESPQDVVAEMVRASRRWVILIEPNRYNPIMFAFGLLVREERPLLRSHPRYLRKLLEDKGLKVRLSVCTGMISQNNTPASLVPLLRRFDEPFMLGEYVITVAENPDRTKLD